METASMTRKPKKTDEQLEIEHLERKYQNRTDRQLLEEQTYLAELNNNYSKSIKNNVQFFFWIFIVSIALWIIFSVLANTELPDLLKT